MMDKKIPRIIAIIITIIIGIITGFVLMVMTTMALGGPMTKSHSLKIQLTAFSIYATILLITYNGVFGITYGIGYLITKK